MTLLKSCEVDIYPNSLYVFYQLVKLALRLAGVQGHEAYVRRVLVPQNQSTGFGTLRVIR